MTKYIYPAIFTSEENGSYSVYFPDLEGCYTCGDDLKDSIFMAKDVLAAVLYDYERQNREIPSPSHIQDISVQEGEFVNYIACDTLWYRKKYNQRAVKKTLTIPEWLNELAVSQGINFSQVLQEALMEKVGIKN